MNIKSVITIILSIVLIVLTGCDIVLSPTIEHNYIPLFPDTIAGRTIVGGEIYYWPYDKYGIDNAIFAANDTLVLILMDTHSSNFEVGRYISVFHSNGFFKLGIHPYLKGGIFRTSVIQKNFRFITNDFIIGTGVRIVPHFKFKHFMAGATLVPFSGGLIIFTLPVSSSEHLSFVSPSFTPEMLNLLSIFAYISTEGEKMKAYIGPSLTPISKYSLNGGIAFYRNGKEFLRFMLSLSKYQDTIYKKYNLYPYAFMLSIWKPLCQ